MLIVPIAVAAAVLCELDVALVVCHLLAAHTQRVPPGAKTNKVIARNSRRRDAEMNWLVCMGNTQVSRGPNEMLAMAAVVSEYTKDLRS